MNEDLQPGEVMENELDKMLRTVIDYLGDSLIYEVPESEEELFNEILNNERC